MNFTKKKFLLIDSSFKVIEQTGWKNFTLEVLSKKKKIPLNEINEFLNSRTELLKEFSNMIDMKVEDNIDFKDLENSNVKDNLFELIMLRLEIMQPYKQALKKIVSDLKNDALSTKTISLKILNSLDFYLDISSAYNSSVFDILKKKAIFLIYGYVFMIWLNDSTQELSKTMSELDRLLSFSEKFTNELKNYTPF